MTADGEVDSVEERLGRLKAWLLARGVSQEDIDKAIAEGQLHLLAIDTGVIPPGPHLTGPVVAARADLPLEVTRRLWRALGFPDVGDEDPAFTELDAEAVRAARTLIDLGFLDVETAIQLARVFGSSMARIAEAEVESSPVLRSGAASLELAEVYTRSIETTVATTGRLIEYVWRRHLQAALRRTAMLEREVGSGYVQMTVGFADQVGSTALAQQLSERALAEVVTRFENLAYDTVVRLGGRLVKMIGDEAMYTTLEPATALDIALALSEAYADDEMLSDVRIGVACGPVLLHDGDYYGPVVNLANRIVKIAAAGTVVVSDEIHSATGEDGTYDWRPLRPRYLKGLGRIPLWVVRQPGEEAPGPSPRSRRRWLLREASRQKAEGTSAGEPEADGDQT